MINIRQILEERETGLRPEATRSRFSAGRSVCEDPCPMRTAFQVDRDRILHCKAFRRLGNKTQVFLSPQGDHYRTRLTHTLEVAQIARTISRALLLNEDLTEAIALGHDLGHTPFGHAGEQVLNELLPGGFHHVRQSLRVVDCLEKGGRGLNLSKEVRDGIRGHSKGRGNIGVSVSLTGTLEGMVVRLSDIIAYVNHDLDDALRAGVICADQFGVDLEPISRQRYSERISRMIYDVIESSEGSNSFTVCFSSEMEKFLVKLREWLFLHVYKIEAVQDEFLKAARIIGELYNYFCKFPDKLPVSENISTGNVAVEIRAADFIAGMTDRYALNIYHKLFIPNPWKIF